MEAVDKADAGGVRDDVVLRGDGADGAVVRARQQEGLASSRARAAVQAELDKIRPVSAPPPVEAAELSKEREAVAARGRIVAKTAGKVATDEHTWDLYVEEQGITISEYPTEAQVVEFSIWMTRRRERACLAQRAEAGARRTGLGKRTIRNMLTELFTHAWPRRWAAFATLGRNERAAYEDGILKQFDGVHKMAALTTSDGEPTEAERGRAVQLTTQTAPVTQRKHFYRTEVHQIQDSLLAEEENVNAAIALGAACAIMQTTAARCGMLTMQGRVRRHVGALVRRAPAARA